MITDWSKLFFLLGLSTEQTETRMWVLMAPESQKFHFNKYQQMIEMMYVYNPPLDLLLILLGEEN